VWENEPAIDLALLNKVYIGTPHIAGYSADGKANATRMSLEALARHFNLGDIPSIQPTQPQQTTITAHSREEALLKIYNPHTDSRALKASPSLFEQLRGDYPLRREEQAYELVLG
jgi:erythronate-4-phosphate dehydrogenase